MTIRCEYVSATPSTRICKCSKWRDRTSGRIELHLKGHFSVFDWSRGECSNSIDRSRYDLHLSNGHKSKHVKSNQITRKETSNQIMEILTDVKSNQIMEILRDVKSNQIWRHKIGIKSNHDLFLHFKSKFRAQPKSSHEEGKFKV